MHLVVISGGALSLRGGGGGCTQIRVNEAGGSWGGLKTELR